MNIIILDQCQENAARGSNSNERGTATTASIKGDSLISKNLDYKQF